MREVTREMTMKAGQKCTAIRKAIVPAAHAEAVVEALKRGAHERWSSGIRGSTTFAWDPSRRC